MLLITEKNVKKSIEIEKKFLKDLFFFSHLIFCAIQLKFSLWKSNLITTLRKYLKQNAVKNAVKKWCELKFIYENIFFIFNKVTIFVK